MILAIDPGSEKCGLARLDDDGVILELQVVPRTGLVGAVRAILDRSRVTQLVLGDGTSSRLVAQELKADLRRLPPLEIIDEHGSTLEARALYFEENPPGFPWSWIPLSMQTPSVPIDDYAAAVLARRFLQSR